MIYNYNSGPAILPKEVLETAQQSLLNFNNSGLSILEIGHRTALFESVITEARQLVLELMELHANYEVLFLHGGATTQFSQVPMNLLSKNQTAAYINNGIWGQKAIAAAHYYGQAIEVSTSADKQHRYINKQIKPTPAANYLHYTSNNTVEGTQWQSIPNTDLPLIADMSSDILSRPMDFNRFSMIYAGLQKNIGAAGACLVVIDKQFLEKFNPTLPPIFDYKVLIANQSLLNTPPVFAIYVALLTLRWIKKQGGLKTIEQQNQAKASLFYNALDTLPIFKPLVQKEDRSLMNATFAIENPTLEKAFQQRCNEENLYGIKGYRTVGGFRVSMYNALPMSSVEKVVEVMQYFNTKHG